MPTDKVLSAFFLDLPDLFQLVKAEPLALLKLAQSRIDSEMDAVAAGFEPRGEALSESPRPRTGFAYKPDGRDKGNPAITINDGLLLLHTHSEAVWNWWSGGYSNDPAPERKNKATWELCGHVLKNSMSGGGNIIPKGQSEHRWLLWAIFPARTIEEFKRKKMQMLDSYQPDSCLLPPSV